MNMDEWTDKQTDVLEVSRQTDGHKNIQQTQYPEPYANSWLFQRCLVAREWNVLYNNIPNKISLRKRPEKRGKRLQASDPLKLHSPLRRAPGQGGGTEGPRNNPVARLEPL